MTKWVYLCISLLLAAWNVPLRATPIPHIRAASACAYHLRVVGNGSTAIGIAHSLDVNRHAFLNWLTLAGPAKAKSLQRIRPGYVLKLCTENTASGGKHLVAVQIITNPFKLASVRHGIGHRGNLHTFKLIPGMSLPQALYDIHTGYVMRIAVERYARDYWRLHGPSTSRDRLEIGWRKPHGQHHTELVFIERKAHGHRQYLRCFTDWHGHLLLADRRGRIMRVLHYPPPLHHARISSGWGWRTQPILGFPEFHKGIDYAAPTGTPIHAVMGGVVEIAHWHGNYGRMVEVSDGDGIVTRYGHMLRYAHGIVPGRHVRRGQILGYVGNTGLSTGPHLYFEVWRHGIRIDPLPRTLIVRTYPPSSARRHILASVRHVPAS